ncbi:MAG TPA: hypothetical protein VHB54_04800 [Mucilaginibacter sp.]|nr:hypothetical protein [Mucilaginibacter sp.]
MEETDIIELKFEGDIKPSNVKASEIADLIIAFESAIEEIIKEQFPAISEDQILVSFEEITGNSIGLKSLAHFTKYVIPAFVLVTSSFQNKNFNSIPNSSIEKLRKFTAFAKKYNCDGAFYRNGVREATFTKTTEVAYNDKGTSKGETTLYGEVQRIGGEKKPRVLIKINNDYNISFEVKKSIAIQLGSYLYKFVGINGFAQWDNNTYKILTFSADSIIETGQKSLVSTFTDLANLYSNHLTDLDSIVQYE